MEAIDLETKNRKYREEIERILEENNYLDNYLYAEYIIKAFINDDRNYQKGRFFRITKITNKMFKYCEEVVKFLNPSLYQEYLEAVEKSQVQKIYNMKANINLIARGIETGHLSNGSKFDILDFYRFIPFKESGLNFVRDLKSFMCGCDGLVEGAYEIISNYMADNNIYEIIFASENNIIKNKTSFGDAEIVTAEVIHNCFKYMFALGLPKVEAVFKIVLRRYLNGEIDFDDLEKMEAKSRKSKDRKAYHNPHKLKFKNEFNKAKK